MADFAFPTTAFIPLDQHVQVRPWEGFAPEAVKPREDYSLQVGDGPQYPGPMEPEEWTEQAACHGQSEVMDDPSPSVFRNKAKPLCDGCQVRDICLSSALEEEQGQALGFRATVRGGMTAQQRLALTAPEPPRRCPEGHSMSRDTAVLARSGQTWFCGACRKAKKSAYQAERIVCPDCGEAVNRSSLGVHRKRRHQTEEVAA